MPNCIICSLEPKQKKQVDDLIKTRRSHAVIANEAKKLGIAGITAAIIMRHKANHMNKEEVEITAPSQGLPVVFDTVDFDGVMSDLTKDLLKRDYHKEAVHQRLKSHVMLERIATKQMILVDHLLTQYSQGMGAYPNDQIRGMKITLDLLERLPTYADKTMLYHMKQISSH
jgi:hypothetical protein